MASNQTIEIPAQSRESGRHASRVLRAKELVPCVVYGPKLGNMTFATEERVIRRYLGLAHENAIFTLTSQDSKLNKVAVMFKAKDLHPVTRRPTHIDFYALDMTKTVRVNVELKFTGKPIGLADGGLLETVVRDIEVECLPTAIPDSFTLDVSELGVHDALHASDIKLPDGVKLITDPSVTLVTVTVIREEEAAPAAAAAAPTEPEVIAKGKEKDGAAAAPGAAAPAAGGAKKAEGKKE